MADGHGFREPPSKILELSPWIPYPSAKFKGQKIAEENPDKKRHGNQEQDGLGVVS